MHGNGNDFVMFDEYRKILIPEEKKSEFVKKVCNRRFGVGGDGAIFVQRSEVADVKFRYFNSDGSEAEMCGNGIRCFARFVFEKGYVNNKFFVETIAGVKKLEVYSDLSIKVDMGVVEFSPERIPAERSEFSEGVWHAKISGFDVYAVNTGVPHAVVFVKCDELRRLNLKDAAKPIRYSKFFPAGINVNFACIDGDTINVRTYERGVEDETLSCGTGSVAVVAVANKLGMCSDKCTVKTAGGKLKVELWNENGENGLRAYITGKAVKVFEGRLVELI
jgi:diaminopimelate epimerase